MAVKGINKSIKSMVLLLSMSWLKCIQAINCNNNCYSVETTVTQTTSNIYCYEYTTTFDPACSISGIPKLTFYVNNAQCDTSENDLLSVITETTPFFNIPITDNIGVGIQLRTNNNPLRICVRGTSQTTTAPLTISDDSSTCRLDFNQSPDFCAICNNNDAERTCFCHNNADHCVNSIRPRGDLTCFWDAINNKCNAVRADICPPDPAPKECVCYWNEDECSGAKQEGRLPCDWDSLREHCAPDECIDDNFACPCMKTEQDCENDIVDFPTACSWENEECVQVTDDPTEMPTMIPTTNPFNTIDPYQAPTEMPVVNTIDPTEVRTMEPTVWNKRTTTYWNKPTKKPGCDDDKKGKGDGKKGKKSKGNKGSKGGRP